MCHFFVPSTHNTVSIDWLKNEINKKNEIHVVNSITL